MTCLRALAFVVLAGCADATLPAGALITCASDAGCPPGTRCAQALGRCVEVNGDGDAPFLLDAPAPVPAVGNRDTTFRLDLVANEPLGRPPEVTAHIGGIDLPPFTLVEASDDRRSHRFTYVATGDEPPEVATVEALLVDERGNVAAGLAAGTLSLDFTSPGLAGDVIPNVAYACANTAIDVPVALTEPLIAIPTVTLVPLDDALSAALVLFPTGATSFRYRVAGDEAPGRYSVRIASQDIAGNAATIEVPSAIVTLDFLPPSPAAAVIESTALGDNDTLFFSLHFNEGIQEQDNDGGLIPTAIASLRGGDPLVDILELDTANHIDVDSVQFTRRIRDCDPPGTYDVTVDAIFDFAGNQATAQTDPIWHFVIEGTSGCP